MRQILLILAFMGMGLTVSHTAQATLIGDEVFAARLNDGVPQGLGPFPAIVVAGTEEYTPGPGLEFTIDIEASSIVITSGPGQSFAGGFDHILEISDLDWVGMPTGRITGISAVAENLVVGPAPPFNPYDTSTGITFSDHAVQVDLAFTQWGRELNGTTTLDPGRLTIELQTTHDGNNVPEPLTSMLGIMGLGALTAVVRRR